MLGPAGIGIFQAGKSLMGLNEMNLGRTSCRCGMMPSLLLTSEVSIWALK